MGKVMLKKAGQAATQSVLRDLMPSIDKRFDSLQSQMRAMEGQLNVLRDEMQDRYERQLNLINEINNKIVRLEGTVEGYMKAISLFFPQKTTSKRRAG